MKKLSVLAIVALMATASCTKDRTCTCTYTGGGEQKTTLVGVTKAQAKANCVSTKTDYNGVTVTGTCKLD